MLCFFISWTKLREHRLFTRSQLSLELRRTHACKSYQRINERRCTSSSHTYASLTCLQRIIKSNHCLLQQRFLQSLALFQILMFPAFLIQKNHNISISKAIRKRMHQTLFSSKSVRNRLLTLVPYLYGTTALHNRESGILYPGNFHHFLPGPQSASKTEGQDIWLASSIYYTESKVRACAANLKNVIMALNFKFYLSYNK